VYVIGLVVVDVYTYVLVLKLVDVLILQLLLQALNESYVKLSSFHVWVTMHLPVDSSHL